MVILKTKFHSLHLLFLRPGYILPIAILPLDILADISAYILVSCSFHFCLFTNLVIGWIPQDSVICQLLILFLFCHIFSLALSSHLFSYRFLVDGSNLIEHEAEFRKGILREVSIHTLNLFGNQATVSEVVFTQIQLDRGVEERSYLAQAMKVYCIFGSINSMLPIYKVYKLCVILIQVRAVLLKR